MNSESKTVAGHSLQQYSRYARLAWAGVSSNPAEAWTYFTDYVAQWREGATDGAIYAPQDDWEHQLHSSLNLSSADELAKEFWGVWSSAIADLRDQGIDAGPETYKWWNDGDAGLARAIWFLVRVLRPQTVVETGVGHGVTSRVILEALQRNGSGCLWSIDRPPAERELERHVGLAVGDRFQDRWTLIRGSSRRELPGLLKRLGKIDLFIHDSLHTARNVQFEVDHAWAALRGGGAVVVDDIDANPAFLGLQNLSGSRSLICEAEPLRPDLRRFNDKGLFGILFKGAASGPKVF